MESFDPTKETHDGHKKKPETYFDGHRGLTKNKALTKKIATLGARAMIASGKRYSMTSERAKELVEIRRKNKRLREAEAAEVSLPTTVKKVEIEEDEPDY